MSKARAPRKVSTKTVGTSRESILFTADLLPRGILGNRSVASQRTAAAWRRQPHGCAARARMSETAVTKTVVLPATRDDVWRALTSPDELSAWLGYVVELDARPGGAVIIRDATGAIRRGIVEVAELAQTFVVRWRRLEGSGSGLTVGVATRVAFELADEGQSTRLTVREEQAALATSRFAG